MKPISQENEYPIQDKSTPVLSQACTRCGHGKSWSSSLRPSDNLFHILFYKPYRCRACMSRFWKLYSSFRLNVCIAGLVLLLAIVGVCAKSFLSQRPIEQTLGALEDDKMKRRAQEGDGERLSSRLCVSFTTRSSSSAGRSFRSSSLASGWWQRTAASSTA